MMSDKNNTTNNVIGIANLPDPQFRNDLHVTVTSSSPVGSYVLSNFYIQSDRRPSKWRQFWLRVLLGILWRDGL